MIKDVSRIIAARGASITATQKIALGPEFCLLMYIWCPGDEEDIHVVPRTWLQASQLQTDIRESLGTDAVVEVSALDLEAQDKYVIEQESIVDNPAERVLSVECSQRPGLILAITELLYQQGCLIPKIETTTFVKNGVTRFRMDAKVQVTGDVDAITAELMSIQSSNTDLELYFDSS